ncbi:hypothetical protein D3C87_1406860 [compost metagenome]
MRRAQIAVSDGIRERPFFRGAVSDDAFLAAYIGRHAYVAGHVFVANHYPVANFKWRTAGDGGAALVVGRVGQFEG